MKPTTKAAAAPDMLSDFFRKPSDARRVAIRKATTLFVSPSKLPHKIICSITLTYNLNNTAAAANIRSSHTMTRTHPATGEWSGVPKHKATAAAAAACNLDRS